MLHRKAPMFQNSQIFNEKMCDENDIVKIEFERKFNQFDPKCVFRKYG